jgi:hypothetical protein
VKVVNADKITIEGVELWQQAPFLLMEIVMKAPKNISLIFLLCEDERSQRRER